MKSASALSLAFLTLLLAACGGSKSEEGAEGAPRILAFAADPDEIEEGAPTRLSWETEGAARISIFAGTQEIDLGAAAAPQGSVEVRPTADTVYRLVATSPHGRSSDREVTVKVAKIAAPSIRSFTASPSVVKAGEAAVLAWETEGADAVRIAADDGRDVPLGDAPIGAGSVSLTPARSTTYILTASRGGKETTAEATVALLSAPVVSVEAQDAIIEFGGQTRLTWSAPGAAHVVLSDAEGIIGESMAEEGAFLVSPSRRTLYTLAAEGPGGIASATVEVAVRPAIVSLEADAMEPVSAGEQVTLRWHTAGAARVTVSNLEGFAYEAGADERDEGSVLAPVGEEGTFRLTAELEGLTSVESIQVDVLRAPAIQLFEASPAIVTTSLGTSATTRLAWSAPGATSVAIDAAPGGALDVSGASPDAGSIEAQVERDTTFTLTATNAAGSSQAEVTVSAVGAARIESFRALPRRVAAGETFVLSWTTANGVSARVEQDGGGALPIPSDAVNGSIDWQIDQDATFSLYVANAAGDVVQGTIPVAVGAPIVDSFGADATIVDPGQTVLLSWSNAGGISLSVSGPDGDVAGCATSDPEIIDAGGCAFVAPTASGPVDLELVVANGLGQEGRATLRLTVQSQAEVVSFEADPAEVVAGEPVTLSWNVRGAREVELSPVELAHVLSSSSEPFIDLSTSPNAQEVPYADICGSAWPDEACPVVTFPASFAFPFGGSDRTAARVYANGLVSFDLARTGPSVFRAELPDVDHAYVHLAPFWSDLAPGSGGRILYDVGQDAKGAYLVIQWSHYEFLTASDLNFEVVLYADGDFDFRYETMTSLWQDDALGGWASIGYQNPAGTIGDSITYMRPLPSLPNSSWSYRLPHLPSSGTLDVYPSVDTTYELLAHGFDGSQDAATAAVVVHPAPILSATASAMDVDEGETFTIDWSSSNLVGLTVFDANGPVHVASASELEQGSVSIVASGAGAQTFTLEGTGALGRQIVATVDVNVRVAFGLDTFTVDAAEIPAGGSTTLRWTSHGATDVAITRNGVPMYLSGYLADGDSVVVAPTEFSTYTLTVTSQDGRTASLTRTVRVVRVHVDTATASPSRVALGGAVDVSWTASSPSGDPASVFVIPSFTEIDPATYAFEDISATGTPLPGFAGQGTWGESIPLPIGFTFPFLGEVATSVHIEADGYLSFDPSHSTNYTHGALPGSGTAGTHLAPFWGDLTADPTGQIFTKLVSGPTGDRFIIQWKGYLFESSYDGDLNFEVVLFPDGSFEYRYGTMSATDQWEADGSYATIGFQDLAGRIGQTFSLNREVPGGLSNRGWRFEASRPSSGTIPAVPGPDGVVRVCAVTAGDIECKDVLVDVVKPGDLVLTELMLDPTGGIGDQWFEIRNLSARPIDLRGFQIRSGTDTHVIAAAAPLLVQPGQYRTLAAGPAPGFTPDYVYAAIWPDPADGDLSLELDGTVVTSAQWDSSWTIPAGASLSLDGLAQSPFLASQPLWSAFWCESTAPFGAGDAGSPGAAGAGCITEYDVDFYSSAPFIDIAATGAPLGVPASFSAEIPGGIPFAFPFFGGANRTTLFVEADGRLFFAQSCFMGMCFPDESEGAIDPFFSWTMGGVPASSVQYEVKTVGGRQVLIVQFNDMGFWTEPGTVTFQAQLWAGGDVVFAYPTLDGGLEAHGASASVRLVAVGAMEYLDYSSFQPSLREGQSIRFHRR